MKISVLSVIFLFLLVLPGMASEQVRHYGNASWYGRSFQGKRTASGESFDMHEFTGAHRNLPFGTMVKVKNLRNGKEVLVRVNDRGPFIKSRIIDVSRAAATALGIISRGTARVSIEVISHPYVDTANSL
jgi:rare lipoprotein A